MAANDSECHNSRRLIRAIEIAKYMDQVIKMTGRHVPKSQAADESTTREATQMPSSRNNYDSLFIGIKVPPIELRDRIHKRLIKRLKIGMLTEAKHLHEPRTNSNPNGGLSWKRMNELGLEYRYEAEFIQGRLTRDLFIEVLSTKIWQYSRRQMTWFKRNGKIKWFKSDRIRSIETYIDHKINTNVALFKAPRRR
jgi:tRNA dimethylallyltransferase